MSRLVTSLRLLVPALTILLGAVSFADDIVPAPFRGQNATSTVQEWEYFTFAVPLVADGNVWGTGGAGFVNPFGPPTLVAVTQNAAWLAEAGGGAIGTRRGVWSLPPASEAIAHIVPSTSGASDRQAHWVQVTWHSSAGALNPPIVLVTTTSGPVPANMIAVRTLADQWFHGVFTVSTTECISNPRVSVVSSGTTYLVDQVVVDAICTRQQNVAPNVATIRFGRVDSGNVASLLADDNDALRVCRFIVPNTTVPPIQAEIEATSSNLTSLLSLSLRVKSRMVHAGAFRQTLEHFDYVQGQFSSASSTQPFPPTFAVYSVPALGTPANFLGPNGSLKGRWSIRQVGPASVSAWCAEIEQWEWQASF